MKVLFNWDSFLFVRSIRVYFIPCLFFASMLFLCDFFFHFAVVLLIRSKHKNSKRRLAGNSSSHRSSTSNDARLHVNDSERNRMEKNKQNWSHESPINWHLISIVFVWNQFSFFSICFRCCPFGSFASSSLASCLLSVFFSRLNLFFNKCAFSAHFCTVPKCTSQVHSRAFQFDFHSLLFFILLFVAHLYFSRFIFVRVNDRD